MLSQSKNQIIKLIATIFVFYGFIDSWGETLFSTTSFRGHHSIYDLAPSHPVSSILLHCIHGSSLWSFSVLPAWQLYTQYPLPSISAIPLLHIQTISSLPLLLCILSFYQSSSLHLKTLLSPPHSGLSFSLDDSEDSFALPLPLPSANSSSLHHNPAGKQHRRRLLLTRSFLSVLLMICMFNLAKISYPMPFLPPPNLSRLGPRH